MAVITFLYLILPFQSLLKLDVTAWKETDRLEMTKKVSDKGLNWARLPGCHQRLNLQQIHSCQYCSHWSREQVLIGTFPTKDKKPDTSGKFTRPEQSGRYIMFSFLSLGPICGHTHWLQTNQHQTSRPALFWALCFFIWWVMSQRAPQEMRSCKKELSRHDVNEHRA